MALTKIRCGGRLRRLLAFIEARNGSVARGKKVAKPRDLDMLALIVFLPVAPAFGFLCEDGVIMTMNETSIKIYDRLLTANSRDYAWPSTIRRGIPGYVDSK